MARIVQTPGGWQVRWYDGRRNERGKLIETGGQVFDRKADATAEKRRVEKAQRTRREAKRGGAGRVLSLDALLILWAESTEAERSNRASYRAEKKRVLSQLFADRGWRTVVDVTPEAIDTWRREARGVGVSKRLQMLRTLLRYGAATQRQPVDPAVILPTRKRRQQRPQPVLLAEHEVDFCLACAQARGGEAVFAIFEHLATYGCRPIDACKLRVGDFDPVAGTVTLRDTKNGTTVTHPLLPRHVERYAALCRDRLPTDALFLNPYGEGWRLVSGKAKEEQRAEQLTSWWKNNVSSWLLPEGRQGVYCLKDYAISRMDARGIDDRTKALFTGHRSLEVFAVYKATNQQRARAALNQLG